MKMCRHVITDPRCDICVAYREGREACDRGERSEGDPYVADLVMRKAWRAGWMLQHTLNSLPTKMGD
jgi:hypothetical protein